MLDAELKWLTQQLEVVCAAQVKGVADRQVTKNAVDAREDAEREVLMRIKESEKLRGSYNQTLLARNAEVAGLKVPLAGAQKRAAHAEYE